MDTGIQIAFEFPQTSPPPLISAEKVQIRIIKIVQQNILRKPHQLTLAEVLLMDWELLEHPYNFFYRNNLE